MTKEERARNVFSMLMQTARKRELTYKERIALSNARQTLRRAKRPAMNPRNKFSKGQEVSFMNNGRRVKAMVLSVNRGDGMVHIKTLPEYGGGRYEIHPKYLVHVVAKGPHHLPNPKSRLKALTVKSNPATGAVKIYGRVLQIKAEKASDSNFPNERFYHNFKRGAVAYGLPNGDILIRKEK